MAKPIKHAQLVVAAVEEPAPGVKRFTLADEDGWRLPPFRPGAHIDLYLANGQVRTYSLCNAPDDDRRYVIAVKKEQDGRGGSRYLHEEVKVGDRMGVSVPRGGIQVSEQSPNVFVAGGIGITPFISAVRDMERRGLANYVLHWSSMGPPSLKDMLEPQIASGRVRLYDTTRDPLPDLHGIVHEHGEQAYAYCCGPAGMLDAFEACVGSWPDERKHVERFTAPKAVPSATAVPFTVVLAKSGREAVVRPELGLLATLEDMEADVSVSCAGGICGACRTRWLEGQPIHRDRVLSPQERQTELIVCVAECASPRLVLDL